MCRAYERKLEPFFVITPHIAEFWNTVSNLPFIIIGLLRLYEGTQQTEIYTLLVIIGIGSSIHHATTPKWTLVIDYIPIFITLHYFISNGLIAYISYTSIFKIALSISILISDHVITFIPVPWGHVCWHLVSSLSIDGVFQDVAHYY